MGAPEKQLWGGSGVLKRGHASIARSPPPAAHLPAHTKASPCKASRSPGAQARPPNVRSAPRSRAYSARPPSPAYARVQGVFPPASPFPPPAHRHDGQRVGEVRRIGQQPLALLQRLKHQLELLHVLVEDRLLKVAHAAWAARVGRTSGQAGGRGGRVGVWRAGGNIPEDRALRPGERRNHGRGMVDA